VSLPPARINVVHRSDGSGMTYIFSNYLSSVYLSSVDPAWRAKIGTGKTLRLADRGSGRHPQPGRPLRRPVHPRPSRPTPPRNPASPPADFSIVNQPGAASYAISGALVYARQQKQSTGQARVTMLDWLTHDGQASAATNDYVPLPA